MTKVFLIFISYLFIYLFIYLLRQIKMGEGWWGVVFSGGQEMKIFSTVFQYFEKKHGLETVFSTLDGAGNY